MSSNTDSAQSVTLAAETHNYLTSHASELRELPAPEEHWEVAEVAEEIGSRFRRLQQTGVIEKVATRYDTDSGQCRWRTRPAAYRRLQSILDEQHTGPMPCAAGECSGRRWINHGADLECKECGTYWDVEQVRGDRDV